MQPHWVDLSLALAAVLVGRGDAVDLVWSAEATPLPDVPPPLLYGHWLAIGRRTQGRFSHPRLRLPSLEALSATAPDVVLAAAADPARKTRGVRKRVYVRLDARGCR